LGLHRHGVCLEEKRGVLQVLKSAAQGKGSVGTRGLRDPSLETSKVERKIARELASLETPRDEQGKIVASIAIESGREGSGASSSTSVASRRREVRIRGRWIASKDDNHMLCSKDLLVGPNQRMRPDEVILCVAPPSSLVRFGTRPC